MYIIQSINQSLTLGHNTVINTVVHTKEYPVCCNFDSLVFFVGYCCHPYRKYKLICRVFITVDGNEGVEQPKID